LAGEVVGDETPQHRSGVLGGDDGGDSLPRVGGLGEGLPLDGTGPPVAATAVARRVGQCHPGRRPGVVGGHRHRFDRGDDVVGAVGVGRRVDAVGEGLGDPRLAGAVGAGRDRFDERAGPVGVAEGQLTVEVAGLGGPHRPRDGVAGGDDVDAEAVTEPAQLRDGVELPDAEAGAECHRRRAARDRRSVVGLDLEAAGHLPVGVFPADGGLGGGLDADVVDGLELVALPALGGEGAHLVGEVDALYGPAGGLPPAGVGLGVLPLVARPEVGEFGRYLGGLVPDDDGLEPFGAHHRARAAAAGVVVAGIRGDGGVGDAAFAGGPDAGHAGIGVGVGDRDGVLAPRFGGLDPPVAALDDDPDRFVRFTRHEQRQAVRQRPGEAPGELAAGVRVQEPARQRRFRHRGIAGFARQVAGERADTEAQQVLRAERVDPGVEFLVEVARAEALATEKAATPPLGDAFAADGPCGEVRSQDVFAAGHSPDAS